MTKGEITTIHVPKAVTIALWILVSAAMAGVVYALSGRAYVQERASIIDVVSVLQDRAVRPADVLATLAPVIADMLFFLPWGALAFLALDRDPAARGRTYALTLIVGVAFALGLTAWQKMLPTRVTGGLDVVWNTAGCLAGALAGHARKRMRIRFE